MPSSTIWRRYPQNADFQRRTPSPPPVEPIESFSPNFDLKPSSLDHTQHSFNSHQNNGYSLTGLGLSYTSTSDEHYTFGQSRELYLDDDGKAHLWNAPLAMNDARLQSDHIRANHAFARPHTRDGVVSKRSRTRGHTRSGSTIDDLASAAIATSPTFTNGSPQSLYASRPATSYTYNRRYEDGERPTKRFRSEKLPTQEWSPKQPQENDLFVSVERRMHEAELLLGLRNPLDFKYPHGSPPSTKAAKVTSPARERIAPLDTTQDTLGFTPETVTAPLAGGFPDDCAIGGDQTSAKQQAKPIMTTPTRPKHEPLSIPPSPEIHPISTSQNDVSASELPVMEAPPEHTFTPAEPVEAVSQEIAARSEEPQVIQRTDEPKRPKRIKPETQTDVCAKCQRLQREGQGENEDGKISWIICNHCNKWFHSTCVGFKDKREAQTVDKFFCANCEPTEGPTTFVRKSSRARTAIDYAELNQGLVKSSADTSMHHYIQPIKEGKIALQPDSYARVRPELVTAEFFARTDGIKRPLVVPACWNPRFGQVLDACGARLSMPLEKARETGSKYSINQSETLSAESCLEAEFGFETQTGFTTETVIDCEQDLLDMVMPRELTVRKVADIYGPEEQVIVIDVKSQSSSNKWTMRRWADYYESTGDKPIRNVISLEISNSRLSRIIRRPKFVRDTDLQDLVWPETVNKSKPVQLYCLMSVADSFTDFHIDFGGSSVYYHILQGKKTFFFIPPEDKNLKKYEDWCNSDTQETTWLGDLTGECCRVDLSEGDTMIIPAGWIHAVWTPEDSLVIGGNFLTHTDYAMQLKVVEVERNTNVQPNFRYPFFQKVMWYTLIKYLDDDPIPEEVLDDFNQDEEYVFLRANNVWHEIGEMSNISEPGEPDYNARFYPKAEILGLPALRDYLLRTAMIASELPVVPPVNKDTAKKVKASIPKTHGEPMDLIRTFAVWCAWKTGNTKVPDWARPDAATVQKVIEKREKVQKPEAFRIPGERSSSRRSSNVTVEIPRMVSTPTKLSNTSMDVDSDDGKPSSGSKTSGLGPKRVACDICRKRRIRCRHKDEEELPTTPESTRHESLPSGNTETPKQVIVPTLSNFDGKDPPDQTYTDFGGLISSDLAQAALATLDYQDLDPALDQTNTSSTSSGKKGRSKACEECRKSKRRCVHDEFGNLDPAKAAEPSKPRGSTNTKRAAGPSDEQRQSHSKKLKIESDIADSQSLNYDQHNIDALIDPALTAGQDLSGTVTLHNSFPDVTRDMQSTDDATAQTVCEMEVDQALTSIDISKRKETDGLESALSNKPQINEFPNAVAIQGSDVKPDISDLEKENVSSQTSITSLASPPDSTDDDVFVEPRSIKTMELTTSIEVVTGDNSDPSPMSLHSPLSASRHSSRHPKAVDRYVPEDNRPTSKPAAKSPSNDRRASSSGASMQTAVTSKSRRSSSNTSGTTHQLVAGPHQGGVKSRDSSARPSSRGSIGLVDSDGGDADERFARELQAQENGLRRRVSARA